MADQIPYKIIRALRRQGLLHYRSRKLIDKEIMMYLYMLFQLTTKILFRY